MRNVKEDHSETQREEEKSPQKMYDELNLMNQKNGDD